MKRQRTDHSGPENYVHLKLLFWTAVKDSEPKLQDISTHPHVSYGQELCHQGRFLRDNCAMDNSRMSSLPMGIMTTLQSCL